MSDEREEMLKGSDYDGCSDGRLRLWVCECLRVDVIVEVNTLFSRQVMNICNITSECWIPSIIRILYTSNRG